MSMTFSEFINLYAKQAYIGYCSRNNIEPELDLEVVQPKLCALVKPRLDPKVELKYNDKQKTT